jgi:phosphopantothenoylcysteine decarboxylase / phosphopantothenate---cysteine ligase
MLVGFAAETDELVANAKKKLKDKNLDMIVANDVTGAGAGFDVDTNIVTILDRCGGVHALPLMSKDELAEQILDYLLALKNQR